MQRGFTTLDHDMLLLHPSRFDAVDSFGCFHYSLSDDIKLVDYSALRLFTERTSLMTLRNASGLTYIDIFGIRSCDGCVRSLE